jgi:ribosomal protein S18 acetylase RimI-like enzyme
MEIVMKHQSLDRELEDLAGKYGPPKGRTFLARSGGEIVGGIAYNKLADGICEMKRLYVTPAFHGKGLGRKLCDRLIQSAEADGYELMRLDTARHLIEAIGMYETMGFCRRAPYRDYPAELLPYLVFMEKPLAPA